MPNRIGYNGSDKWKIKATQLLNEGGGGGGDANIITKTTAEWNALTTLVSELDTIYVYSDFKTVDGVNIPAVKIGDGLAYVVDLPFSTRAITQEQIDDWDSKVKVRTDGEKLIFEN